MRMSRANALHDFIISNIIFVGSKGVGRSTATDNGSRETKIVGRIERERERDYRVRSFLRFYVHFFLSGCVSFFKYGNIENVIGRV